MELMLQHGLILDSSVIGVLDYEQKTVIKTHVD